MPVATEQIRLINAMTFCNKSMTTQTTVLLTQEEQKPKKIEKIHRRGYIMVRFLGQNRVQTKTIKLLSHLFSFTDLHKKDVKQENTKASYFLLYQVILFKEKNSHHGGVFLWRQCDDRAQSLLIHDLHNICPWQICVPSKETATLTQISGCYGS